MELEKVSLDHVVYAVPDLEPAVADLEARLGVRASSGGSHPGLGTRNALLALGPERYLEVIGPDPEQGDPQGARPFGIDTLERGRLRTFAVKAPDLDGRVARARDAGYDPGMMLPMSRRTPDGRLLEWRLTLQPRPVGDGLVPFLIDWGATPSPAHDAPAGCTLVELCAEHPDPPSVMPLLAALDVPLRVDPGTEPALVCVLDTPRGRVELR